MDKARIKALSILGYNFGLHLVRSLAPGEKPDQAERFRSYFRDDRIAPFTAREHQDLFGFESCVACGLCPGSCRVKELAGGRFEGPMSLAIAASRSQPDFIHAADGAVLCAVCGQCEPVCPQRTPVAAIARSMRAMLFRTAPEALPPAYRQAAERLSAHGSIHGPAEARVEPDEKKDAVLVLGPTLRRRPRSVERIVSLLAKLGLEVAGVDEGSIGGVAFALGLEPDTGWVDALADHRATEIVVADPEAWLALGAEPRLAAKKITPLLAALERRLPEKLELRDAVAEPAAVHLPYPFARRSDLGALATRMLLHLGLTLVALDPAPEEAPPLGWEGGLELAAPDLARALAQARVAEARAAGARTLIALGEDDARLLAEAGAGVEVVSLPELLDRALC